VHAPDVILGLVIYGLCILVSAFVNRRDFARSPEKAARYRALPLRYKCMCWFGVLPLFAGTLVLLVTGPGWWKALGGAFYAAALIAFAFLEGACVRWYRRKGML
jgi:hypothetical protein